MEELDPTVIQLAAQEKVLSSTRPLVARPAMSQPRQVIAETQSGSMRSRAYFKEQLPQTVMAANMKDKDYEKMIETLSNIKMVPLVYFICLICGSSFLFVATEASILLFIVTVVAISMVMFRMLKL